MRALLFSHLFWGSPIIITGLRGFFFKKNYIVYQYLIFVYTVTRCEENINAV